MDQQVREKVVPLWLHGFAVLTVALTVVLLFLGGRVTTFRVGMADPVWPTPPWYLLVFDYDKHNAGFLIEHTHRLVGWIVGACTIVLAVGLWLEAKKSSLRWLGWVALGAVIVQGLLGGFRVRLHALLGPNLALIHGVFAQVVFCILVGVMVLTSPRRPGEVAEEDRGSLRRIAMFLVGVVFLQVVWGAMVRQDYGKVAARLHLLTAFGVAATAIWLVMGMTRRPTTWKAMRRLGILLTGLLIGQVFLGVEAWLSKFARGFYMELEAAPTVLQATFRTLHVVVGAGVLATSVAIVIRLGQTPARVSQPETRVQPHSRTDAVLEEVEGIV
jgi:heme A synthase